MKYRLACDSWDDRERQAAKDVIDSGFCTMGRNVRQFEQQFASKFGARYAVMSNSGSSANLLAVAALCHRSEFPLCRGDEVIVPAVSWATTYYPFHQYGLKLKFVDVSIDDFNLDISRVEEAIGPKTRAICAVNLLGVPCDFERLTDLCRKHDLVLIEDNCESMGATYNSQFCGTFGDVGTFSTFFSHHLCTIEGGVTVTDDEELYEIMVSMRSHGWTRDLGENNRVCAKTGNPFDDLFRFVLPGYNIRPNEVFAAIGLHQLEKLDGFLDQRRKNRREFEDVMNDLADRFPDQFRLQESLHSSSESSWFGFGIVLNPTLSVPRADVVAHLQQVGIECRPIVAGNFTRNPVMKYLDYEVAGELTNADVVHDHGFFIGNSQMGLRSEIHYFAESLERVLSRQPIATAA